MTESGESLSNSKKYCSVLEKISKINDVKQNEKHPFIFNVLYYVILFCCCTFCILPVYNVEVSKYHNTAGSLLDVGTNN